MAALDRMTYGNELLLASKPKEAHSHMSSYHCGEKTLGWHLEARCVGKEQRANGKGRKSLKMVKKVGFVNCEELEI
ncbi:MAG TPA: hypothetical protein GX707_13575 [Epulopiscium sp.]|nr:hypothetical protein [Candidatus Epulonipiscium sp.]